jgi:hypothetical protein
MAGVRDSMGFEAYYVNTLRPNDAAMLIIGDPIVQLGNAMNSNSAPYTVGHLAPSQDEVHRQATCPGTCTKDFTGTINVFAHFYHMHHYGKKIYTEKYAATAPPTAAGGANLGVVGSRIDHWDNGFQQAIAAPYTVSPGDTLQTHCWFSTSQVTTQVTFGTPTSSEMCQDFLFYYPAQFRGVDARGNRERFAMCGLFNALGNPATVCGSLDQAYYGFMLLGSQVNKGDGAKADPLNFGIANRTAPASTPTSPGLCTLVPSPPMSPTLSPSPPPPSPSPPPPSPLPLPPSPSPPPPSPSPPPPSPSPPPPSPPPTMSVVGFSLRLFGDVSSFTSSVLDQMKSAIAARAGVGPSAVEVTVTAGSVIIGVSILTPLATSASVQSAMANATSSPSSATAMLANVTGVSINVLTVVTPPTVTAFAPSPPPAQSIAQSIGDMNDEPVRVGSIIIGAVLGSLGLIFCILFMAMIAQRKRKKMDVKPSIPAKKLDAAATAETTVTSSTPAKPQIAA